MHALVLSGGGAKGAYQANELVNQIREGFTPDIIYGNSIGALNAVIVAYQKEKLSEIWRHFQSRSSVLHFNWRFWNATGIYNTKPLRRLLEKCTSDRIPFCEVVVCDADLMSRQVTYSYSSKMPPSRFLDAVEASASMPLITSPIGTHVDGGIRQMSPLKKAIEDGADQITVLLCNPYTFNHFPDHWKFPRGFLSFAHIGARALDILENEIFIKDLETCFAYNHFPGKKFIDLKVFGPRQEDLFINTLEFDAIKINYVFEDNIRMVRYFPDNTHLSEPLQATG
jgi:NTE family protein